MIGYLVGGIAGWAAGWYWGSSPHAPNRTFDIVLTMDEALFTRPMAPEELRHVIRGVAFKDNLVISDHDEQTIMQIQVVEHA